MDKEEKVVEEKVEKPAKTKRVKAVKESAPVVETPVVKEGKHMSYTNQPKVSIVPNEHILEAGDCLKSVADKYHVTMEAIMKLNKITDVRSLKVGQVLKLR